MQIKLSNGMVAHVDARDYKRVSKYNWNFQKVGYQHYAVGYVGPYKQVRMHRFIMGEGRNGMKIDHRDRNGLNNRRSNLRWATNAQNCCNHGPNKNNKLGIKGVQRHGKTRFRARIRVQWVQYHIGTFKTLEEAAMAYRKAARKYQGEFACFSNNKNNI